MKNNNISLMVPSWWDSIKRVAAAADMQETLRNSCRVLVVEDAWLVLLLLLLVSFILDNALGFLKLLSLLLSY